MHAYFILVPVLLPIVVGVGILIRPIGDDRKRNILTESAVILNTLITWWLLFHRPSEGCYLFSLSERLPLLLKIDGMGMFFGGLVSFLWPLATLYAFEYMKNEERVNTFMGFYTITYGVTLGVAFSGNLITMYLFYEALTLVTLPLVMHPMTKEARRATRKYLYYMIGGTAFAFIGIVFYSLSCTSMDFVLGGNLDPTVLENSANTVFLVYVLAFFGFGVKSAIFPFHGWLPTAAVAPTPVTALLHAVAVVKSGVFAVMRLTYYCFGADVLRGSWAQAVALLAAMVTIVYASTMGVREPHVKRRLAYSTVSNLSYIVLSTAIMTPLGLVAALCHMFTHAIMKINAFFCAGAIMKQTGKNYVYELDGLGRDMPITFGAILISGLSLAGLPLFAGFVSKWNIVQALLENSSVIGVIGVFVLLYSALVTAVYMLSIAARGFFAKPKDEKIGTGVYRDPSWRMTVPFGIFCVIMIVVGVNAGPLLDFLGKIAAGVL